MKILLVGHEDSKKIISASSWLVNKYIPEEFDVYWLNYGEFNGKLYRGKYVELDREQVGGVKSWSKYLVSYLKRLDDDKIILALDDYLLSGPLDLEKFYLLNGSINWNVVCARLCDSSFYDAKSIEGELIRVGVNGYTCTTQYCIWKRNALIQILEQIETPWEFELEGSQIMNRMGYKVVGTVEKALDYPDYSCLSSKWTGVKTDENNQDDIKFLKENGIL